LKVASNYVGNEEPIVLEDVPDSMFKLENPLKVLSDYQVDILVRHRDLIFQTINFALLTCSKLFDDINVCIILILSFLPRFFSHS
jgi:hypothetical protein